MENRTELIGMIVKGMSDNDIILNNLVIYEEAIKINDKVKVMGTINNCYLVQREGDKGVYRCMTKEDVTPKVLELLTENDWLPGDVIENDLESCTLVVENGYYRRLYNDYSISDRMTLGDLRKNYTNVSLETRLR